MFNAISGHPISLGSRPAARGARRGLRTVLAKTATFAVPVAALSGAVASPAAMAAASHAGQPATTTGVTWHKLKLLNGWQSSQSGWNSGDPSYAVSGGVVYLSGSLHGGAPSSDFAILPRAARPAHWLYMTVSMWDGTAGTLLIKSDGEISVYSAPQANATVFSSLAGVSYPSGSITQHKITLKNGWISGQTQYHTGDPAYAVKNGIVYMSGSLKGDASTSDGYGFLPAGALPAHIIYRGTYTLDGVFGEVYFEPAGYLGVIVTTSSKAYTSLAGISFPISTVAQHKVTLLNGWKSGQTPFGAGGFSYAVKNGVVYLSGAIQQPSGTSTLVAVLPKAARPAHRLYIPVYTSSDTLGTAQISPNGRVYVTSVADPSAARAITSLATISYPRNS